MSSVLARGEGVTCGGSRISDIKFVKRIVESGVIHLDPGRNPASVAGGRRFRKTEALSFKLLDLF